MCSRRKEIFKKVLPVGLAMGVLFSANPFSEKKVHADVIDVLSIGADIYSAFVEKPLNERLLKEQVKKTYTAENENFGYLAPTFQKGKFAISVFDFYKNKNFSKKVKIYYDNTRFGDKVEEKTIKHGEQLIITEPRTIVAFYPDENDQSKQETFLVTQEHLNMGNKGVALSNWQTYYVEKDPTRPRNHVMGIAAITQSIQKNPAYAEENFDQYFERLSDAKQRQLTVTTKLVTKSKFEAEMNSEDKGYMKHYIDNGGLLEDGVYLYQHADFAGKYTKLTSDQVNFKNISINDSISSIKVVGNYEVIGYSDADFKGRSATLTTNNSMKSTSIGNDAMSSIKIKKKY
ncbi:hypothetical protein FC697_14865 [Bacillus wiedmannii]|uniref:beta/gamma crystallin-related protein n=1 Tax=Bacillus wiedmannii TaxID=1890302 RepID=UPI0010BD0D5D|nr:beta/gamma crystallin-related protein [Bacillus wiedmannii]TKH21779.1 hypothetical protein FC697_14865 [Bacillus wiedmannii]